MGSQLANLFRYLPAGFATVWVMATPYFNRPVSSDGGPICSGATRAGLSIITALLGALCWIRAATSLYSYRCSRQTCRKGPFWFVFSVFEGAAVTSLFAAVAVLTPPGSTCFLYNDDMQPIVTTFTTYNILTAATLLAFSVPRLLSWLLCLAELLGIQVRRDGDVQVCGRSVDSPGEYEGGGCTAAAAMRPAHRGILGALFDNDALEWYIWQLLPCGSVLLYQIATAYYSSYSPMDFAQGACTTADKSWLLALIAVIGTVGFFVTLQSFEYDCFSDSVSELSMFRSRGVWYRMMAFMSSIATAGSFVAVALLTPPAGPCLFLHKYQDNSLQVLGTCLLPPLAAAALLLGLLRYSMKKRAVRYDITTRPAPSAPPLTEHLPLDVQVRPLAHHQQFVASSV